MSTRRPSLDNAAAIGAGADRGSASVVAPAVSATVNVATPLDVEMVVTPSIRGLPSSREGASAAVGSQTRTESPDAETSRSASLLNSTDHVDWRCPTRSVVPFVTGFQIRTTPSCDVKATRIPVRSKATLVQPLDPVDN